MFKGERGGGLIIFNKGKRRTKRSRVCAREREGGLFITDYVQGAGGIHIFR